MRRPFAGVQLIEVLLLLIVWDSLSRNLGLLVIVERFPLPLGAWMGYVILLWHSLSLPYNYFKKSDSCNDVFISDDKSIKRLIIWRDKVG